MKKIGQIIEEIDKTLEKVSFVPAPQQQQGQEQGGGQPQPGQGDPQAQQGQGGGIEQLLSQLPPEIANQIKQLPPEQQQQALEQVMQQLGGGQEQGGQPQASAQPGQEGRVPVKEEVQGNKAPTDLQNSTITLRVADLLDLVSGGNATKSQLKVQEHIQNGQLKQQQMQEKAIADKKKREQQEQLKQQQAQQQNAMAAGGANMMGGGIYGGQQGAM